MKGFKQYTSEMLRLAREVTESPELRARRKELEEAFSNHLFGLPGPTSVTRDLSPYEILFRDLFYGFVEISNSYDRLRDLHVYFSHFPFAKTRVTRLGYLTHNVEAYLNEIYLFQNRLLSYTRRIGRSVQRHLKSTAPPRSFKMLEDMVHKSLGGIVDLRSSHVHQIRYRDQELDRLQTLELLVLTAKSYELQWLYQREYRRVRSKWRITVTQNNRVLKKLLDAYFAAIFPFVFGPQVQLLPSRPSFRPRAARQKVIMR